MTVQHFDVGVCRGVGLLAGREVRGARFCNTRMPDGTRGDDNCGPLRGSRRVGDDRDTIEATIAAVQQRWQLGAGTTVEPGRDARDRRLAYRDGAQR